MASSTPVPVGELAAAKALIIGAAIVGLLKQRGMITADGSAFDFTRPAEDWAMFAKDVDELLVEQGVAVPANLQKAISGAAFYLPIILTLLAQAK